MIKIRDYDDVLRIAHQNLLNYTGYGNLVAAALVYRLFEIGIEALSPDGPPDRRSFVIRSAFNGPGVLDGIEYVTRARSEDRLIIEPEIGPGHAPSSPFGRFYFELYLRNRGCALVLKDGFFTPDFAAQVQQYLDGNQTPAQRADYRQAREKLADRILTAPADDLFDRRPIDDLPAAVRLLGGPEPRMESRPFLKLRDGDDVLEIGFDDMVAYHGRENIGGVALAFKALEFALKRLSPTSPLDRGAVRVFSAFGGTGALDGFETALRVVSEDRLELDVDHKEPGATAAPTGTFYFRVWTPEASVALTPKAGAVPERFMSFALKNKAGQLSLTERSILQTVKEDLAIALMSSKAEDLFDELR